METAPPSHPLLPTFQLLETVSDERVQAWGKAFDWTQPVVSSHEVDGQWVDRTHSAAELLLQHGNPRLTQALLRPDMFDTPNLARRDQTVRYRSTDLGTSFDTPALWMGLWCRALRLADPDQAASIARLAGPHLSVPVGWQHLRPMLNAVATLTDRSAQRRTWRYLLEQAPCTAPEGDPSLHQKLQSDLVELAIARLVNASVVDTLFALWPGRPTSEMLRKTTRAGVGVKGLARAMKILSIAADRGFSDQAADGRIPLDKPGWGQYREWVPPMTLVVDRMVEEKLSAQTYCDLAVRLMDWPSTRVKDWPMEGELAQTPPTELTEKLSSRAHYWTPAMLRSVQALNPTPSARELAWLMLGASDEVYAGRLADMLESSRADQEATWKDLCSHLASSTSKGNDPQSQARTKGFERLWRRAATLSLQVPSVCREELDAELRAAAAVMYRGQAEVAARMLALYDQCRMEQKTAAATTPRAALRL